MKLSSLKINSIWNLFGSIFPMLLGLVTIPYLIAHVGVEKFGILTLIWTLIGYFSLFDFGIGRALTIQVSNNLSKGTVEKLPGIIKTGVFLMFLFGILGGALLVLTSKQLGYKWLNVNSSIQETTYYSLLIASIGIPLTTIVSGLKGVLEGYEDFKTTNILKVLLGLANFGLPALTVMFFGPSLEWMVFSLIFSRFIIIIAHLIAVNYKISNWLSSKLLNKKQLTEILSFGAWMTLSNIISPLMVTADRFIISYMLGASFVAYYTVPFDMIVRLLVIPAALTGVLFPRFAFLYNNNKEEMRRLYSKSTKTIALGMATISLLIAIGSYWGLSFWLGVDFAKASWIIASILAIGLFFNSLAQIPHAAIQATGDVKSTSIVHLFEFIIYIPLLFIFLNLYGVVGAAIVWVIRVLFDYLILNFIKKKKI
jgi:O-antigen/teichoic acid export membrane protein